MRNAHTLIRLALLGSVLAVSATSALAGQWSPEQKRLLAIGGMHALDPRHGATTPAAAPATGRHAPATYTVMHSFAGRPSDGDGSGAEVTLDGAGNIYGTTDWGGAYGSLNGYGTIFKLATDGTESLLHSFGSGDDGKAPDGAITIQANGDMIGTTVGGGTSGNGIIWTLAADGTYTVLHNFTLDEANFSRGRLIQDRKGNFYGTSLFGGAVGDGTVYRFNAKGKVTVLHTFNGADGDAPEHGVISDKAGNLYGVTAFGGTYDDGTVYEIAKDGTFSTLYNFTGGADGSFLYGGLAIDRDGNLYGSADASTLGYGTVFKLAPDGTFTVLYTFTGGTGGANPEGDMLRAGKNLYSTTVGGGDQSCGCGVIYEITAKGKEKVLEAFNADSGNEYSGGLVLGNGTFYGTTQNGSTGDNGVVFSLTTK